MIDLHIHSTASDGQYAPRRVVEMAKEKGLDAIALTDHDTVDGLEEAAERARELDVFFIPGIEISVQGLLGVKELHILGYWIDTANEELLCKCAQFRQRRQERAARIHAYLEEQGVPVSRDAVQALAGNGPIGRPHFARAMVDAGYVDHVRDAFDRYLDSPAFQKIKRPLPAASDGISLIRKAGGIPVLAHPVQTKLSYEDVERLAVLLKDMGLEGLECYYSTHTPQDVQCYLSIARRLRFMVTGGSDFHGETVKPRISMGTGIDGSLCVNTSPVLYWKGKNVG